VGAETPRHRGYDAGCRPGDRGAPLRRRVEESPDTTGQDAGASQAAKADGKWNRKQTAADGMSLSGDVGGKGETVE
jgi:hypothetical protein